MKIKEIINAVEKWAPAAYAEDFDNVGLLVGDAGREATGVLVALDTLEETVDEAVKNKCNLILSFHPIIFKGLKKITGKSYVERVVIKAIKNDIAIYAVHTALDNSFEGVNAGICDKLNLKNRQILVPKPKTIKKLVTFVPHENAGEVREALFEAGAGNIGNYDRCSFNAEGKGSFNGNESSNPAVGQKGKTHVEPETRIDMMFPKHLENKILNTLFKAHPYEEVAYEVDTLDNINQHIGIGMVGTLDNRVTEAEFIQNVKDKFHCGIVRHSRLKGKKIKTVAVLGGSGAFAIPNAIAAKADIYLTGDLKYHDFFQAENQIILADMGHYESERFTKDLLFAFLKENFPNFANVLSEKNTNPIQYS
jgi:dinuclear metal center YbgI/SA1388 family protein